MLGWKKTKQQLNEEKRKEAERQKIQNRRAFREVGIKLKARNLFQVPTPRTEKRLQRVKSAEVCYSEMGYATNTLCDLCNNGYRKVYLCFLKWTDHGPKSCEDVCEVCLDKIRNKKQRTKNVY